MIFYINQRLNGHPRIQKVFRDLGYDFRNLEKYRFLFDPSISSYYNRYGQDTLHFKNGLKNLPGFAMPAYDATFNQSWSEITDQRCHELRQRYFDKKWVIAWSGGIDSTTMLASIIKNLPAADFDNIIIACNKFSVWENPKFFQDFVQPNFQTIDSMELLDQGILNKYIVINGEPSDQLFAGANIFPMMLSYGVDSLEKDIVKDADFIIKYIAYTPRKVGGEIPGEDFAQWYYTALIDNIRSVDIPVNTFHDLMWWVCFNFTWTSVKLRELESYRNISSAEAYMKNFVHWFDSDSYQLWAMTNNLRDQKYGSNLCHYKLAAKQYIFDLDKNPYFFKYKTKLFSSNYKWYRPGKVWYCMTDDFELLNIDDHWPIIQDLLPDHLCET